MEEMSQMFKNAGAALSTVSKYRDTTTVIFRIG